MILGGCLLLGAAYVLYNHLTKNKIKQVTLEDISEAKPGRARIVKPAGATTNAGDTNTSVSAATKLAASRPEQQIPEKKPDGTKFTAKEREEMEKFLNFRRDLQ